MISKNKLNKIFLFVASFVILFLALNNVHISNNIQNESDVSLLGMQMSTYVPSASALPIEIYCWDCGGTDICGHVEGGMCCMDNIGGGWNWHGC